jgi:hypothetical protein
MMINPFSAPGPLIASFSLGVKQDLLMKNKTATRTKQSPQAKAAGGTLGEHPPPLVSGNMILTRGSDAGELAVQHDEDEGQGV